ncbi:MAG: o-succinylbenzoate synthase, partial [Bacteroidota bacterium]
MLKAESFSRTLKFRFLAGTSRGTLTEHVAHYIRIFDPKNPEIFGVGEAAPLKGLSVDYHPDFEKQVDLACRMFTEENFSRSEVFDHIPPDLPSLRFAFETALLDLENRGKRLIFDNSFYQDQKTLPINGLIWMGDEAFMQKQIEAKL